MDISVVGGVNEIDSFYASNKVQQADNISKISDNNGDNNGSKEITREELQKSIDKLNTFIADEGAYAEISAHDTFKNDIMVKVVDKKTKDVILEVPPKKILDMIAKMCKIAGVIFDKKA